MPSRNIFISSLLSITLLFRICFLSLSFIGSSNILSSHAIGFHKIENVEQVTKASAKELVNNINSVVHFFKNRIIENKKIALSFLFFLLSIIHYGIFIPYTRIDHPYSLILDYNTRKYISFSVLRI